MIKTETTALLVDAGISCKKIMEGLADTATPPEQLEALLITHEHSDHIKGVGTVAKKLPDIRIYASGGTWSQIENTVAEERRHTFITGQPFAVGDIEVKPFNVSHDAAEPVGYTFIHNGKQLSILTDTGCLTEEMFAGIENSDLLILEANYEVEMLLAGRYPYFLKCRIQGDKGHLSNIAAADTICRLAESRRQGCADGEGCLREEAGKDMPDRQQHKLTVLLAHLSKENNMPELAYQTVKNRLEEKDCYIGDGLKIELLYRDRIGDVYTL